MKNNCNQGLALLLLGSFLAAGGSGAARAADVTVDIVDFTFRPSSVTVTVGDTVTWVQRDLMAHTTTSGQPGVPDGLWDSGLLNEGQSFSHQFDTPGRFPYFCIPHSGMTGTVIVEGAATTPPTVSITSPANNATFTAGSNIAIEASASATGSTIAQVEFLDGDASLGVATNAPYSISVTLAPGQHTLTARATDSSGATAVSGPVAVTVTEQAGGTPIDDPFPARLAKGDFIIELETVADGLISPLGLAAPDDGSGRVFVYDQAGLVYSIVNGTKLDTPLLDVRDRLIEFRNYDERGLLGIATHPNFTENPFVYTYTSEPSGGTADFTTVLPGGATNNHQSVIAEWRIDAGDTNRIDVTSRREILRIDQPQGNHNGGTLQFGHDGFLYISLGDGGSADDQGAGHVEGGNGQNIENIYGNLLRIDVDGRTSTNGQYAIPTDNPFVGQPGLDEIYAYGFRNPYTFGFDLLNGELYVADVGQNKVEELNRVFKGGNYGWPIKEGDFYFDPNGTNAGFITTVPVRDVPADLVDPIAQYDHDEGLAIVSGYVYRGTQLPGLIGRYIAGDWGSFNQPTGRLFYLDGSEFRELRIGRDDRPLNLWLKGIGQDATGELYIFGSTNLGPSGASGKMLKIVPAASNLEIASVNLSSTNLTFAWSNGIPPFAVQSQTDLADGHWQTTSLTVNSSGAVPFDGAPHSFFRVAEVSGGPAVPFSVVLSGAAERPNPVQTSGSGTGTLSLNGNTLRFDIQYGGLTAAAVAAHIHGPASAAEAAGVLIDLAPYNGGAFGTNGTLSGSVVVTPEQKALLLAGRTYVNVHTPTHGSGEIRGQIVPVSFAATLSGGAERPEPVATAGHGSGTFLLAGDQLSFSIRYQDLSGAAVAAHIHGPATPDQAAGVLIDLAPFAVGPFGTSGAFAGTVMLSAEQLAYVIDGLTYVNVHTPEHGSGEIRGQIVVQPLAVPFSAILSGAAERPTPVESAGTGTAYLTLEGNRLRINASYAGLSGSAVAAHIHGPADASEAAGVMIDLAPYNDGGFGTNGTFSGTIVLSDEQRSLLMQGLTYINIHTPQHGAGEIRGQISPVLLQSVLLGAAERPAAVETSGAGTAQFLLIGSQLRLNATYAGLTTPASAAHIHGPADTSASAGVLVGLEQLNGGAFGMAGSFAGTVSLTPEQLAAVLDGFTYLNVHTGTNPSGEIRGQIGR